jgi:phosphoglycolate phosphatase
VKRFDVDVIVFDLDGTLIDSRLDIANALNWTLDQLGYQSLPLDLIESYVGNGIAPLIKRTALAADAPDDEEKMFKLFRQRYWDHLLDDTRLFDMVDETVHSFVGKYKMAVVSNKPERYTKKIIEQIGLYDALGDTVYGGDTLPVKKPDPAALLEIADKYGVTTDRILMVGDSAVDMETAKNAGAACVGVTYGFRPVDEIREAGADKLIDRFEQLKELVA